MRIITHGTVKKDSSIVKKPSWTGCYTCNECGSIFSVLEDDAQNVREVSSEEFSILCPTYKCGNLVKLGRAHYFRSGDMFE